jgi:hypothetical protein
VKPEGLEFYTALAGLRARSLSELEGREQVCAEAGVSKLLAGAAPTGVSHAGEPLDVSQS